MTEFAALAALAATESALFAAVLFLLFGLDDLLVDAVWAVVRRWPPLPGRPRPVPVRRCHAVFVPAWRESATIAAMLRAMSHAWPGNHVRIFVGVYPNDLATMLAVADVAARDRRIRLVINDDDGPTSKGACLNRIWHAAMADARRGLFRPDTIILHDAEDLVDPSALAVFDAALRDSDFVQLPVIPVADPRARWIGGHYCDEFAEAHLRDMPVRSALGAALPLAGVGCALSVAALRAMDVGSGPFAADSLTEDYELGIRMSLAGFRGRFVVQRVGGRLVGTRSCFPGRIDAAVRQKTRWMQGIAFEGWDRIGWVWAQNPGVSSAVATLWMLWRDRRSALAAVAVFAAYAGLGLLLAVQALVPAAVAGAVGDQSVLTTICLINMVLLLWRAMVRMWCTAHYYGWRHAPLALLRIAVANVVLVMTAWRAMARYWRRLGGSPLVWDKTEHQFPAAGGLEALR